MRSLPFVGIAASQYEMLEDAGYRKLLAHMQDLDDKVPYAELLEGNKSYVLHSINL